MFLAVPQTGLSLRAWPSIVGRLVIMLALFLSAVASTSAVPQEALKLELPENKNLRVENLRGGIIVEVWNESYVSVTAISDKGELSRSPAVVQRTDALLS